MQHLNRSLYALDSLRLVLPKLAIEDVISIIYHEAKLRYGIDFFKDEVKEYYPHVCH